MPCERSHWFSVPYIIRFPYPILGPAKKGTGFPYPILGPGKKSTGFPYPILGGPTKNPPGGGPAAVTAARRPTGGSSHSDTCRMDSGHQERVRRQFCSCGTAAAGGTHGPMNGPTGSSHRRASPRQTAAHWRHVPRTGRVGAHQRYGVPTGAAPLRPRDHPVRSPPTPPGGGERGPGRVEGASGGAAHERGTRGSVGCERRLLPWPARVAAGTFRLQ